MSLIQDALKRQQEEFGDGVTRKTPSPKSSEADSVPPCGTAKAGPPVTETMPVIGTTAPGVPPTSSAPPAPPVVPKPWFKSWWPIASIVVIVIIALVAGGGVVAFTLSAVRKHLVQRVVRPTPPAVQSTSSRPAQEGQAAIQPPAFAKPATAGEGISQPESRMAGRNQQPDSGKASERAPISEAVLEKSQPASEPAASAAITQKKSVPDASTAAVLAEAAPLTTPLVQPIKKAAHARKEKSRGHLQWPTLRLTGLLAGSRAGEGAARINNQMVFVGGEIEGVTLVEIQPEGVLLKYGEETKFLKMGGALY